MKKIMMKGNGKRNVRRAAVAMSLILLCALGIGGVMAEEAAEVPETAVAFFAPAEESVAAAEAVPAEEPAPVAETNPAEEPAAAVEAVPTAEAVPTVETVPTVENALADESALPEVTAPLSEAAPVEPILPEVAAPLGETVPDGENEVTEETVPAVETEAAEEGAPEEEATFAAQVTVRQVSGNPLYVGDALYLKAAVSNANLEYEISWQKMDCRRPDLGWQPCGSGDMLSLTVQEDTAVLMFRAVATAVNGQTAVSMVWQSGAVVIRTEEVPAVLSPEALAGLDAPAAENLPAEEMTPPAPIAPVEEIAAAEEPAPGEALAPMAEFAVPTEEAISAAEGTYPEETAHAETSVPAEETVPEKTVSAPLAAPAEKPAVQRQVITHTSLEGQTMVFAGSDVTLTAELIGFDDVAYSVQWRYSPDGGATVVDVPGAESLTYVYQISEENFNYIWSVAITLAD